MEPEPELSFEEIIEADIPELTTVMASAFDDDAQNHLQQERGGPPGYDDGGFFREWLFAYEQSVGYKAIVDGKIVGATIVWILPRGENILGTIFVDPAHQDRGIGTRIWRFVEETYPDARSWKLYTPPWATKNHYFYEKKCGFHKVGEEEEGLLYIKEMRQVPSQPGGGLR
jgi:GNAT superfamily N-acetyltransferase